MKVVFMGTPEFAISSLEALYETGQEVVLVLSQPDKPKGRGYVMTPSPVKQYALERGTPVITPATLRDAEVQEMLRQTEADLFIVTAYGKILPREVLDMPKLGCVNVHASLLPALRGAAPINRAIMNGDTVGGVTVMYMADGVDTGDMILKKTVPISDTADVQEYHDALAVAGKEALKEFLSLAENGTIPREKQDDSLATYAPKIENSDMLIDFSVDAKSVYNRIRGLSPCPCSCCFIGGKRIKLRKARLASGNGTPSTVISTDDGIEIACGEGSVIIETLCCEGKSVCDAKSFLRGHKIEIGTVVNE